MAKFKLLSPRKINTLPDGYYADGANLYLRIRGESRVWLFRYKKSGKQTSIGLGATHTRDLSQVREIAARMRQAIADGKNPAYELKARFNNAAMTFENYGIALIDSKRPAWRNAKHAQQWVKSLERYVYPVIGSKPPAEIALADIKEILSPLWVTKTETASRLRMRMEAILDYASVVEESDRRNPARWKGNLDKIFPPPRKVTKRIHFASAPYNDVPRIMAELRGKDCLSAYCLRFTILTATRSMEARSAFWSEVNLDKKVWTIPALRMKADREHAVPLCDEAIEILLKMQEIRRDGAKLVFQGEGGNVLSDVAINKTLRTVASDCTTHGFRSSFRIWGAETTSTPSAVLELALAHVNKNKTEAAYQRSDLFERRKKLMIAWGGYCCSGNNILHFDKEKVA